MTDNDDASGVIFGDNEPTTTITRRKEEVVDDGMAERGAKLTAPSNNETAIIQENGVEVEAENEDEHEYK